MDLDQTEIERTMDDMQTKAEQEDEQLLARIRAEEQTLAENYGKFFEKEFEGLSTRDDAPQAQSTTSGNEAQRSTHAVDGDEQDDVYDNVERYMSDYNQDEQNVYETYQAKETEMKRSEKERILRQQFQKQKDADALEKIFQKQQHQRATEQQRQSESDVIRSEARATLRRDTEQLLRETARVIPRKNICNGAEYYEIIHGAKQIAMRHVFSSKPRFFQGSNSRLAKNDVHGVMDANGDELFFAKYSRFDIVFAVPKELQTEPLKNNKLWYIYFVLTLIRTHLLRQKSAMLEETLTYEQLTIANIKTGKVHADYVKELTQTRREHVSDRDDEVTTMLRKKSPRNTPYSEEDLGEPPRRSPPR